MSDTFLLELPTEHRHTLQRLAELLCQTEDGHHHLDVSDGVLRGPNCQDGKAGGCCAITLDVSNLGVDLTKALQESA